MRSLRIGICIFIVILSLPKDTSAQFAQDGPSSLRSLGIFHYIVPLEKQETIRNVQTKWWYQYLDWQLNDAFFKRLLNKIDSGTIQIMSVRTDYPFTTLVTASEKLVMLHHPDSEIVEQSEGLPITKLVYHDLTPEQIGGVTFYEEWLFDSQTGSLEKKVQGFTVNVDRYDGHEKYGAARPEFFVPISALFNLNANLKTKRSEIVNVPFITYDIIPEKITEFKDNDELLDQIQYFYFHNALNSFVEKGKVQLYDTAYPNATPLDAQRTVAAKKAIYDATSFRFAEGWTFDVGQLTFVKKVLGVTLLNDSLGYHRHAIAYIPLNGTIPNSPIDLTTFHIEKEQSSISFGLEYYLYPSNVLNAMDTNKLRAPGIILNKNIKAGKIAVYPKGMHADYDDPWEPNRLPKTKTEIDSIFHQFRILYGQGQNDSLHVPYELLDADIKGYFFFESWDFDLNKKHFEKKIKSMGISYPYENVYTGQSSSTTRYLNIDLPVVADVKRITKEEFLVAENVNFAQYINSAEVVDLYENWEGLPYVDYKDARYQNINAKDRYPFIQGIIDAAMKGKLKVFDPNDASLKKKLSKDKVNELFASAKDSNYFRGDLPSEYTLINGIIFTEDWYIDPNTNEFYKKIRAITLVNMKRRNDTELVKDKWDFQKYFTVKLN